MPEGGHVYLELSIRLKTARAYGLHPDELDRLPAERPELLEAGGTLAL